MIGPPGGPAFALALAVADAATVAARLLGLAAVAGLVAAGAAVVYRWYARVAVPPGVTLLVGLSAVALYLNAKAALGDLIQGETAVLAPSVAAFNSVALLVAAAAAPVGRRLGDRVATDLFAVAGVDALGGDVSDLVQAVGRTVAVSLPDEIEDVEGHDPVPEETRTALAGHTFLFPRGLTVAALRERLVARIKDDYDVGYVDVELTADGAVTRLALGARFAGLGPTLAPGAAVVAVTADPPNDASPGDLVQVFEPSASAADAPERVATAELRATAGDVVTLAVDEEDARTLAGGGYRLVTLPTQPRPEREFASLLRAADETMGAVVVGGALVGVPVGALDATVVALRSEGTVVSAPSRGRVLDAGDTLYVVARPETVRRLEAAAGDASSSEDGATASSG